MNTFDKNLKHLRTQRNLKQEDLADQLNVTRQTVSGWETGRRQPDLDTLKKLAEALDVDVQELLYGSKSETYPRYQRKYVLCTAVFGGIVATLLLFRLFVVPYLNVIISTHRWGHLKTICHLFLPQIGAFAFGSIFPGLIQLFIPVHMTKRNRLYCLSGGLAAILPVILFWLGIPPWRKWILYKIGEAILVYVLPALSGIAIMLGTHSEITA